MILIEKIFLLKNSGIFQNSSEVDLLEVASICKEIKTDKGVTLFSKGDPGNCMYFIYNGSIGIYDGAHRLAELGANEIFGELSLLDSEPRSASAVTETECTLLKIEQESFYDVLSVNSEILKGILTNLCKRLREQDRINVALRKVS